jgi:hypothetical protein
VEEAKEARDATGRLPGISSTPALEDECVICMGELKYIPDDAWHAVGDEPASRQASVGYF